MDPTRGLTETGRAQIRTMADFMVREIGRVDLVISSPFLRAMETAKPMAAALGCDVIETTPQLDPDGKADVAWSDVLVLTHALCADPEAHVLVVSHHPLVNELAEYLCGVKTTDDKFHHAAVMHIHGDGPGSLMEYFVPPKVVEDVTPVIEAAAYVISEITSPEKLISYKDFWESLKHPKHAEVLMPIRARAMEVIQRFFRAQKRGVLKDLKPKLRALREADNKAADVVPDLINMPMRGGMVLDYSRALMAALEAGYDSGAEEFSGAPASAALGEDTVEKYLADHSLTKLTGDLDATTVDRLRTALSDAYDSGADYDGLVKAVQDEYGGFNDVRAGMIAQTEMNAAYNAGRHQLGLDMGFNEKAWDPDGIACVEICIPNVLQGWIGIDEEFESGDIYPPGHPNCDCSLSIRFREPK